MEGLEATLSPTNRVSAGRGEGIGTIREMFNLCTGLGTTPIVLTESTSQLRVVTVSTNNLLYPTFPFVEQFDGDLCTSLFLIPQA